MHNIPPLSKSVLIQITPAAEVIGFIHPYVDNIRRKSFAQRGNHPRKQCFNFGIADIQNVIDILVFVFYGFPHKVLIDMGKSLNTRYQLYAEKLRVTVNFL